MGTYGFINDNIEKPNKWDTLFPQEKMNRGSDNLTTTSEDFDMIHSISSRSAVSFTNQWNQFICRIYIGKVNRTFKSKEKRKKS